MTGTHKDDVDETARLVLMELESTATPSRMSLRPARPDFMSFATMLRKVHPILTIVEVGNLWGKYMGWDGRSLPTHDYLTGQPY